MCSRKGVWHIFSWLTRLIGHAHDEPDEKATSPQTNIIGASESSDMNDVLKIWLETSIDAHSFRYLCLFSERNR